KTVVEALLDFARASKPRMSRVQASACVDEALVLLDPRIKKDNIEVERASDPDIPRISADEAKLKQVFINFVLNAAEANTGKKGILRIEILPSKNNRFCEVHFIDNGPGLSPDVRDRLFEPFVSTKLDKGVGLGLYVSYKIIKSHGGEVVYNDTYKEGAYFIIKLPLKIKERQQ
ncbi:MAG: hypothetical protein GY950_11475, partial [bacterium]|nr:hypothetical protein [bacterium]